MLKYATMTGIAKESDDTYKMSLKSIKKSQYYDFKKYYFLSLVFSRSLLKNRDYIIN